MTSNMKSKMRPHIQPRNFACLILFICTAGYSYAQEQYRNVEFKAFNLRPGNFSDILFYDANGQKTNLEFKKKSRSDLQQSLVNIENGLLGFYIPIRNAEGETQTHPVARVWMNPEWKSPLLIFLDTSIGKLRKYSVIAIEDSVQNFKIGTIKIVNLTGTEIVGSIDGNIIKLANATASESYILPNNERIEVAIATQTVSRNHLLYKNTLGLNRNTRSLLIFRPPKRSGSVKIQGQLLIEYDPDSEE